VSLDLTIPRVASLHPSGRLGSPRLDRAERRRRAEQDRLTARLAELHHIRALIDEAIAVVGRGWLQHDWFAVTDSRGQRVRIAARDIHVVTARPVSDACLVGAIVHAGGGPAAAHTQLVQRTLDLTWHTLYEDEHEPVRWCPAPPIRMAHVRDLTRWNDRPGRTADEVTALLRSATRTVGKQAALVRAS
jgi:hypothetical protein